MKKKWLIGGVAAVLGTGVGGALVSGVIRLPGSDAMAKSDPKAVAAMIKDWVGRGEA